MGNRKEIMSTSVDLLEINFRLSWKLPLHSFGLMYVRRDNEMYLIVIWMNREISQWPLANDECSSSAKHCFQ